MKITTGQSGPGDIFGRIENYLDQIEPPHDIEAGLRRLEHWIDTADLNTGADHGRETAPHDQHQDIRPPMWRRLLRRLRGVQRRHRRDFVAQPAIGDADIPQRVVRRPLIAVGAIVAVLFAVNFFVILALKPGPCDSPATHATASGECVGVSTGGLVFAPDLARVFGLIAAENKAVDDRVAATRGTQAVSVAYLISLPKLADTTDMELGTRLRHELEGAYIAQLRANHTQELGTAAPLIRLLIANTGQGNAQWRPVVDQLIAMAQPGSAEHLVGVVGFGESLGTSEAAITALNRAGIAAIAGVLTADDLSGGERDLVNGFARVAPTSSDEAKAAADFLRETARRVLIVQDTNPDDHYAAALGHEFEARYLTDQNDTLMEYYTSSRSAATDVFSGLISAICVEKPDAIYFAGRGADLSAFVSALAGRSCPGVPISVITGHDGGDYLATELQSQLTAGSTALQQAFQHNLTVRYTGLASPGAWTTDPTHVAFSGTGYLTDSFARMFPDDSLDDGAAITGHDAVLVGVVAIRGLVERNNSVLPTDAARALVHQLSLLHGAASVLGASGRISLNDRGDPTGKPIPIVELASTGAVQFVELATGNGA